ncbi:MAG: hypothetical protein Q4C00_06625 [Bacillota bacterium]|nr:hypothetical protein [Bacillota bacterium]
MNIFAAALTLLALGFFLMEPDLILASTIQALDTWVASVLPALLPFFILNNLCFSYGGIDLFGAFLQPITRKLFNLPGETAFVIATGYSTGAPVSSTVISELRKSCRISRTTGNILLPCTSNVSPLFIFSVVAASFLNSPELGIYLAAIHYGTNLLLGAIILVIMRPKEKPANTGIRQELIKLSQRDTTSLGQALSEAIAAGIKTIVLIGGLLIVFFIFLAVIHVTALDSIIAWLLQPLGIEPEVTVCLIQGITEITAGAKCTAVTELPINIKFSVISFILAWGGISAICQIATQIKDTDLSLKFYFIYKVTQASLAYCLSGYVPLSCQTDTFSSEFFITILPDPKTWSAIWLPIAVVAGGIILRHPLRRILRRERSSCR